MRNSIGYAVGKNNIEIKIVKATDKKLSPNHPASSSS
jgi:hypothetical protein